MIDHNGENIGVVPIERALQIARDANLDLIEVAPGADPPVCRVLDLGKYLFEKTKKERAARKAQTKIEVKEIQLRPKTNVHHRMFKVRDARRWLESGMKVRVTVKFRGREASYPEIALEDLKEVAEELKDISAIEVAPVIEGRSMTLILIPAKHSKKPESIVKKEGEPGKPEPVAEVAQPTPDAAPASAPNVKA